MRNAQLAKYVMAANAGKNMINRRPELMIWRSIAWTMASDNRKPKPVDSSLVSLPSGVSVATGASSPMTQEPNFPSKGFTQFFWTV